MLAGISAGYDRDLAGLQLGWRRLLLRRRRRRVGAAAALMGRPAEAEVLDSDRSGGDVPAVSWKPGARSCAQ